MNEQPHYGVVDGLPGHSLLRIHNGESLSVFCVVFCSPRTNNFSANNDISREDVLGWSFPSGTQARKKQILNKDIDVLSPSRPNVYFY